MKNRPNVVSILLAAAGALLGCLCAAAIMGGSLLVWLPVGVLVCVPAVCFWQQTDRRLKTCFGLLGMAFVIATALGVRLDLAQHTGWDGVLYSLGAGVGLGACAGQWAIWLDQGIRKLRRPIGLTPRKAFWVVFAACVLCWLPVYLAYFPGVTGYDMDGQMWMITSGEYTAHHPLLHTLFLQVCIRLGEWLVGSTTIGYGIHTTIQYLLLAGSMAYTMRWLCKARCHVVLWWALAAFFALSPQNAMLSIGGTKDILFAAAFLMVCVEMIRFLTEEDRMARLRVWVCDILLILLACLLRNNAIYALLAVFMLGVVFFRKKLGVRVLAVLLAGIVLTYAGEALLQKATNAKDGSVREMLCIPCQQLGRVYHLHGLNVPVGYECREVMPFVDDYSPERADFTKRQAQVDTTDRLIRFLKLWLRESVNFPIEYLDGFLFTSKGYWDIHDLSYSTIYDRIDPNQPRGAIVMLHYDGLGIDEMGCWPQVKEWCHELVTYNGYQRNPVLWLLLHPAFYSWMLLFVLTGAWYRRQKAQLLSGGLALFYLLTLLLGPCVLVRYQYYLMLIAPTLLVSLTTNEKGSSIHD